MGQPQSDSDQTFREKLLIYMEKQDGVNKRLEKLIKDHSDEIWGIPGDDQNIGIKAKVKDLVDAARADKENRIWWRAAIGIPVVGLVINWLFNFFGKTPTPHP